MNNEELAEWASFGAEVSEENHPATGFVFAEDDVQKWHLIAELINRVRNLEVAVETLNGGAENLGGF
jgi:hypothetical protein